MSDSESEGFQPIHSDDDEEKNNSHNAMSTTSSTSSTIVTNRIVTLPNVQKTSLQRHLQRQQQSRSHVEPPRKSFDHMSSSSSPPNSDDVPLSERASKRSSMALPPPLAPLKRRHTTVHQHQHHQQVQMQLPMTKFVAPPLSQDDELQIELRRDCDRFESFAFESPVVPSSVLSIRSSKKRPVSATPPPPLALIRTPPRVPPPSPQIRPEFDAVHHIDSDLLPVDSGAISSTAMRPALAPPPTPIGCDDLVNDELCLALLDALTPFVDPFDFSSSEATDIETDDAPFLSAAPALVDSWLLELDDDAVTQERSRARRDVHDRLACAEPTGLFPAFAEVFARASD